MLIEHLLYSTALAIFIFAAIGFGAHLFEDALVSREGYAFFWPLVPQRSGIGLFNL